MRIIVCSPQVPFARGGAEILAERLTQELAARGHEADLVTMPFKWYPGENVLTHALLWRLADLTEVDGQPVDLVTGRSSRRTSKHPNKVVWLVHQFRQAYEPDRTDLGQFSESAEDARAASRRAPARRRGAGRGAQARGDLAEGRTLSSATTASKRRCSCRPRSASTSAARTTATSSCP
jgi:hypothetical protein